MADDCIAAAQDGPASVLQAWRSVFVGFRSLNSALFAEVTERTGLPHSSFLVLSYLLNQPAREAAMSQLARHLEFSTAGITKVTDRLSHAGLLARRPSPTDRRVVLAVLTASGTDMAARVDAVLQVAVEDQLVARIGEQEFGHLVEIMAKLREGLPATDC